MKASIGWRFPALLSLLLMLGACGGHTTRVIDTPETRELKNWQKPYEVDGIRYYPLRDHRGFEEVGIASWYGRKFHGGPTSNGETYDMYALSAAHKTLPLGIYVRVTRLDDDRQIVVRVNDRGPFVAGRIIDLSYGAARQLGIVDSGTTRVRVQALGYRKNDPIAPVPFPPASIQVHSYAVQVGAFASSESANTLAERLRADYGQATVSTVMVRGIRFYRVRVGQYKSLDKAEETVLRLTRSGFDGGFVVAFD